MGSEIPLNHRNPAPEIEALTEEIFARIKARIGDSKDPKEAPAQPSPQSSVDLARQMLKARRLRDQLFGQDLFGEAIWDMMLDLFVNAQSSRRVSISSLCIASAVPSTTALRYIHLMSERGIIERMPDPNDNRRCFVALTEEWRRRVDQFLASISGGRIAI